MSLPDRPSADRFEDLPTQEKDALVLAAQAMHQLAYRYVFPVTICTPAPAGFTGPVRNGTGSLIRVSDSLYVITAGHVISHLRNERDSGQAVQLRIADLIVELDENRFAIHPSVDLALISVTPEEAMVVGTFVTEAVDLGSLSVPPTGAYVLCAGFPVYLREKQHRELEYGALSALLKITTVGDNYWICQFEREQWISSFGGEIPPPDTALGGMSGGPVFLVGQIHYPLVGIITEFHSAFELLRIQSVRSAIDLILG